MSGLYRPPEAQSRVSVNYLFPREHIAEQLSSAHTFGMKPFVESVCVFRVLRLVSPLEHKPCRGQAFFLTPYCVLGGPGQSRPWHPVDIPKTKGK